MKQSQSLFYTLLFLYGCVIVSLSIYSYAFVDLNLTLSSYTRYLKLQELLTQLGYYQRPISGVLFLLGLGLIFGFYLVFLCLILSKRFTSLQIRWFVIVSFLLIASYPAFSHDFFNYMFDARIVTTYHLNPYFFKALDFPFDAWTRFMHWIHRYYPYGPGWLLLTLIPSWLGMGKFVLTLLLFKSLFLFFHALNCYFIVKISQKISPQHTVFTLVFYGLNPLILIESMLSPHNEVMMLTLALASIYLLMKNHRVWSLLTLTISVSIKFVSVILLPLIWRKNSRQSSFFTWVTYLWLGVLIPVIMQREFYPWYLIPVIGFASFANEFTRTLAVGLSMGTLVRYAPFIFTGVYSTQTTWNQNISFTLVMVLTMILYARLCKKGFSSL